jgi:hypothetical protein
LALNTAGEPCLLRRAANGEMEMNAQAPKLEAAENDLKQLRREDSPQGRGGRNRDRIHLALGHVLIIRKG